jgi:shikimate kinase
MNVVLIGYRGTGKSTIAQLLSEQLGWPVCNMDREIVAEAGCSIPEIVGKHGWEFFRDLESRVVGRCAHQDKAIIDAGGGVIVRERNMELLRKNGVIVWLKADPATIISRIREDTQRPSLSGDKSFLEEIEEVLTERTPKYRSAAEVEIETSDQSPETIAKTIIAYLEGRQLL